jgi:hypothetical protein
VASLLEAAAAVGLSGTVLMLATASLTAMARIQNETAALASEMFVARQLEQLIDRAALLAGGGPGHPAAVSAISSEGVVFLSDQNGDGAVDATSAETTAVEARRIDGDARVRIRLGRQTMTVLDAAGSDTSMIGVDPWGTAAGAATATCIDLTVAAHDPEAEHVAERHVVFSVPARMWR